MTTRHIVGTTARLAWASVVSGALLISSATAQAAPVEQSTDFCQGLARAGFVNATALQDSRDPAAMLPALDALVSRAPDDIAADFAVFDQVEHATLDPSGAMTATVANPGTREALNHVATYLRTTCHLTSPSG